MCEYDVFYKIITAGFAIAAMITAPASVDPTAKLKAIGEKMTKE